MVYETIFGVFGRPCSDQTQFVVWHADSIHIVLFISNLSYCLYVISAFSCQISIIKVPAKVRMTLAKA
jgi:hypothetical protein